ALAAIVLGALTAWRVRRTHRWLALGLLGGLAAYLPTFGLIPLTNLRADRYFYLPSLPLSLALAALLLALVARVPLVRDGLAFDLPRPWLAVAAVLMVLGVRSLHQGRIWRDDLALWSHATRVAGDSSRAWNNLAEAHLRRGDLRGAHAAVER